MCLGRDGEVGCWQRKSFRQDVPGGSRRDSSGGKRDRDRLQKGLQIDRSKQVAVAWRRGWGTGQARGHPVPCSLTCLLTSSRLRATPLSALLLLGSFWHFPRLHNRCLMTWERSGRLGGREPPTLCGPAQLCPPYLIGIVKEFQHGEDAGPDEQPHLAPDVTCGVRLEKSVGSGH